MIEEAAGTKMFESQKERAIKTISKKEKRVNEINEQIQEEIAPKLNKLRVEKKVYIEFTKAEKELEKIGRVLRAWEYSEAQKRVGEKEAEIEEAKQEKKQVEAEIKRATKESQQAEKDLNEVVKKRESEMKKGGKLAKLKDAAEELGKQMVKVRTQAEIKGATIEEEEKALLEIRNEIKNVRLSRSLMPNSL
jgi:structural maintenance of chromosome 2